MSFAVMSSFSKIKKFKKGLKNLNLRNLLSYVIKKYVLSTFNKLLRVLKALSFLLTTQNGVRRVVIVNEFLFQDQAEK